MLPMLNEKYMYNNGKQERVDLRITIGSSNEYPDTDDLNAFYDRFIFRHWVNYIQDPNNRVLMARASRQRKAYTPQSKITLDEIDAMQKHVWKIDFPTQLEGLYDKAVRALQNEGINISDRRYAKGQLVMMANAMLQGRTSVTSDDFKSLFNVLWNKDVKELPIVEKELSKYVNPYESQVKDLLNKAEEVKTKTLSIENRTERAGEAVSANATLQEIIAKMDDQIGQAKKAGNDIKGLVKMQEQVENIMEEIAQECLKQSVRASKKW